MTTKRSPVFFRKKIGVTPSVAAPGDTHPSDATVLDCCCELVTERSELLAVIKNKTLYKTKLKEYYLYVSRAF